MTGHTCRHCGAELVRHVDERPSNYRLRMYCDHRCHVAARQAATLDWPPCETCGAELSRRQKTERRRFCSIDCSNKARVKPPTSRPNRKHLFLLVEQLATPGDDWQRHGGCVGIDPDVFYPPRGRTTSDAKAVCAGCVVRGQCLEYALDNNEKFGIWGGLSYLERREIRRQRRRQVAS